MSGNAPATTIAPRSTGEVEETEGQKTLEQIKGLFDGSEVGASLTAEGELVPLTLIEEDGNRDLTGRTNTYQEGIGSFMDMRWYKEGLMMVSFFNRPDNPNPEGDNKRGDERNERVNTTEYLKVYIAPDGTLSGPNFTEFRGRPDKTINGTAFEEINKRLEPFLTNGRLMEEMTAEDTGK